MSSSQLWVKMEFPKDSRKRRGQRKVFEEIMALNLMKTISLYI